MVDANPISVPVAPIRSKRLQSSPGQMRPAGLLDTETAAPDGEGNQNGVAKQEKEGGGGWEEVAGSGLNTEVEDCFEIVKNDKLEVLADDLVETSCNEPWPGSEILPDWSEGPPAWLGVSLLASAVLILIYRFKK